MESNEIQLESNLSTAISPPTSSAAPPQPNVPPDEKDSDQLKHFDQQRELEEKEPDQEHETCACVPAGTSAAIDSQPQAYQHLGAAPSVQDLRRCLETRLCLPPVALRIETVTPSEREGATERGCPAAKWVLRRSGEQEKFLALVRVRPGHACATAVIVVALVSWEGIPRTLADQTFDYLASELPQRGMTIERRCAANESRTCGCQGFDEATCGASYSFGCSWSMFHNACKFARTREQARKFRLRSPETETELAAKLNCLADVAGRVLETAAPDAFQAQVRDSILATDCRLGCETPLEKRPFSGVTACLDFCMHAHKDSFALDGGCNVVVTLVDSRSSDEQLHVLPGYIPAKVDELGSETGQRERISRGFIQSLRNVSLVTRVRGTPLAPCAIRKKVKKTAQQQQQQIQAQQKPQQLAQKHLQHQKSGRAATAKEEHSPASIDSGFESIKSNRSPDKDEQQHQSPPVAAPAVSVSILPPIASWFRKSATQWIPPQQQIQRQHPMQHQHAHMMPLAPPSAPPTQLGQQLLPSPQMPQSATGYPDTRGVGSENPLQQQHFAQRMQQQTNGNRPDPRVSFNPQGTGAEFTHPHPPPPPSQPSPQQQLQHHQHSYQQTGARPMPQYPPQQHQYPGYMPRYPADHQVHQYPGGYPGNHWRPQHPNGSYYSQHQQFRGQLPPAYRQYPYPAYPQQPMQHQAYDIDYSNHQKYYSQNPHQQQHQQPYSQYYPQYPGQNQNQQSQSQLQLQQQPNNNNYPNQPLMEQSQQHQQLLQQLQQKQQQQPLPQQQQQQKQQPSTQTTKRRSSESMFSETSKGSSGDREFLSDCAELFRDERMGGLAIALTHGSVLIEAAKHDSHASTSLRRPNRNHPTNLSLVFFQHKSLSYAHHGYNEYAEKMRLLRLRRAENTEAKSDAAARPVKLEDK